MAAHAWQHSTLSPNDVVYPPIPREYEEILATLRPVNTPETYEHLIQRLHARAEHLRAELAKNQDELKRIETILALEPK